MTHAPLQCAPDLCRPSWRSGPYRCELCGFELWVPIASLRVSYVGLYDDARYPGRLIVSLRDHLEHFDEADSTVVAGYMADIQASSMVLRKMAGVERVNLAVLGNKAPHLHAHLIPRRLTDNNHGVAPWENALPHTKLDQQELQEITAALRFGFTQLSDET